MADTVCVGDTCRQDQVLLLAKAVVTTDGATGRSEDLVLHARERGRRIDRFAAAVCIGWDLFELSASEEKEKK